VRNCFGIAVQVRACGFIVLGSECDWSRGVSPRTATVGPAPGNLTVCAVRQASTRKAGKLTHSCESGSSNKGSSYEPDFTYQVKVQALWGSTCVVDAQSYTIIMGGASLMHGWIGNLIFVRGVQDESLSVRPLLEQHAP